MITLYYAMHVAIGFALVATLAVKKTRFLWLCAFLLPLSGFSVFVGVQFSWIRALPVLLALGLLASRRPLTFRNRRANRWILTFCLYATFLFIWASFVSSNTKEMITLAKALGWGRFQTDLRPMVQLVGIASTLLTPVLFAASAKTGSERNAVIRGFVIGCLASVLFGGYQVAAVMFGLPWPDAGELGATVQGSMGMRETLQEFSISLDTSIPRLFGLGGEPKHTAAFSLLGIVVLLRDTDRSRFSPRFRALAIGILSLGVLLTFSTSGWVGLVVCLFFVYLRRTSTVGKKSPSRVWVTIPVMVVIIAVFLIPSGYRDMIANERLRDRLSGGTTTILSAEVKDGAMLEYAVRHPVDMIFGKGPGCIDFFLIPLVSSTVLRSDSTITPTYMLTRMLGDYGVIGLLLLGRAIWCLWEQSRQSKNGFARGVVEIGFIVSLVVPAVAFTSFLTLAMVAQSPRAAECPSDRQRRGKMREQEGRHPLEEWRAWKR